ncbi:MAG: hypothetical protein WAN61_00385 [Minisyncoccia bacterium]
MESENKTCQNCKKEFTIESEDFNFYEKMKVPAPTWCFDCRMRRKLVYRNERTLYHDVCASCGEKIISMYEKNSGYTVYCTDCWWSDKWDATKYGRDYDFSKTFFEQFFELQKAVPRQALWQSNSDTSPYSNFIRDAKNSYLSFSCVVTENVYYTKIVDDSREVYDSYEVTKCELCYENVNGVKNYNSLFLDSSESCIDSSFLYNCAGCTNCFMCSNLRNQSFHIRNEPYSKEEYLQIMKETNKGSYAELEKLRAEFLEMKESSIHQYAKMINCVSSLGNDLNNTRNAKNCFDCYNLENVKNAFRCFDLKDSMDAHVIYKSELMYEGVSGGAQNSSFNRFTLHGFSSLHDTTYTDSCQSCSYAFGCIGLKSKKYCILNKEYSEEEYNDLISKIIEQMNTKPYTDKKGRIYKYGEFFPIEFSPFLYNETIAQEYYPATKKSIEDEGYEWKNIEEKHYGISLIPEKVSDDIKNVDDSILEEVIGCLHAGKCHEQCIGAFKILPDELQFYQTMKIAIPRLCPNCRHYQRLKQKEPFELWHRKCMCEKENHIHGTEKCEIEFETPYSPERPETIYCKQCYQQEVY